MRHFFSISVLPIILLSGLKPAVADQAAVDLAAATQQQMQQQEQLQQQLMWAQQQQQQQLQQQLMWAQQQQQQQMQLSNGVSGMQPYCNYYGTCPKMGIAPAGPDLFYLLTAHPQEAAPATLEGSPEAADAEFPRHHYSKKKRTARRSQTASGPYRSTRYR